MQRDLLNETQCSSRMSSQKPNEFYTEKSDFTIVNNGDFDKTVLSVDNIIRGIYEGES